MAGGMNFVRFMKGALKGEIAHQEAVAKAEADRIKKQEAAEAEDKKFIQSLVAKIPFEKLNLNDKLIGDIQNVKTIDDVMKIYSGVEQETDNEGYKHITKTISEYAKDNPNILNNIDYGELSVITDMDSAKEYLSMNPSMFDNLSSETKKTDVEKDIFAINKSILNEITKQSVQGKKFTGTPLDFDNIDMYDQETTKLLDAFAKTAVPDVNEEKIEFAPDNYSFTIEGKPKAFAFKGSTTPADIVSNMTTMAKMLKSQADLNDPVVQAEFIAEMRRQRRRAEELFRSKYSDTEGGVVPENVILDIEAFTSQFKNDPDFGFAADLFEAFEKGQPYIVGKDIKDNGDGLKDGEILQPELKGEFSELAATIGMASEEEMIKKFKNLQVDGEDLRLFTHAEKIRKLIPGLFPDGMNMLASFGTLEIAPDNRELLFSTLNRLATDTNSNVEQQISVLSILSNMPTVTKSLGESSFTVPKYLKDYLISIAAGVAEEGKDVKTIADAQALINKKVTDGEDIINLVNQQLDFLNKGTVNTGAARGLIMGIKGFFGGEGQVSQVKDFLMSGFGDAKYAFKLEDFDNEKEFNAALDSAVHVIETSDNAVAATNEVFLAYQIAKYNDEGGRLSNQDYSYNLQAVAGGNFANRKQSRSHLLTVKKRFEKDYTKFKMFRFNASKLQRSNPDAPEFANILIRRLDAAKQYYDMYESGQIKQAEMIRNYPINAKIKAGRSATVPTNSKVQNESSSYFGKDIFQVMDTRTDTPVFEDEGGIFVVREGNRFFTLPFKDIPMNVLEGGSQDSASTSTDTTYTKLDEDTQNATGFAYMIGDNDGFLTQEEYDNLNLNNESTDQ